ncbi:hypothetical protein N784_03475 [Pontibacillus litoralis JSM 072002]|uniref:Uncharacterized protein n=1 Tax=Pontibacillus litoralis JSM 072002 TaxID=1385512 RepID=A0A0A5HTJ7_9BACI|nr:hypothetical protein N784_03475 [Pontibacillus litoralis JSM 072002]
MFNGLFVGLFVMAISVFILFGLFLYLAIKKGQQNKEK